MTLYQSEHDQRDADDGNHQTQWQSCDSISTYSVSDHQYHNAKLQYGINTPYDTVQRVYLVGETFANFMFLWQIMLFTNTIRNRFWMLRHPCNLYSLPSTDDSLVDSFPVPVDPLSMAALALSIRLPTRMRQILDSMAGERNPMLTSKRETYDHFSHKEKAQMGQ